MRICQISCQKYHFSEEHAQLFGTCKCSEWIFLFSLETVIWCDSLLLFISKEMNLISCWRYNWKQIFSCHVSFCFFYLRNRRPYKHQSRRKLCTFAIRTISAIGHQLIRISDWIWVFNFWHRKVVFLCNKRYDPYHHSSTSILFQFFNIFTNSIICLHYVNVWKLITTHLSYSPAFIEEHDAKIYLEFNFC